MPPSRSGETASIDSAGLKQLNWLLRDWRVEKPAEMDPHLFDILWEVYREVGSHQPINVVSAYRSPETNAMLRRRSKAVSEHSQHMAGRAMDIRLPDVDTATLRAAAMKLQYGGVGYYQSSAFVHVDTGSVRAWPRMTEQQLARLFPDGKTVHLPPSGKPLARYDEARLEVDSRRAALGTGVSGPSLGSLFVGLFRSDEAATPATPTSKVVAATRVAAAPAPAPVALSAGRTVVASADPDAAIPAAALGFAPLPPRRPAEALLAAAPKAAPRVQTASLDDELPLLPGLRVPPVAPPAAVAPAPAAEFTTPASRLLFSGSPLAATPLRIPPAATMAAAAPAPSLDLRFALRPVGDFVTSRFSGPAISPVPVQQQASL